IATRPGTGANPFGVTDVFETRDGGFFQGTLPSGDYVAMVKVPGHLYDGGLSTPTQKPVKIGGGTTIVNFDVPATGFVRVTVTEVVSALPIASKVSVVGLDATPDPGTHEFISGTNTEPAYLFGYAAHEKVGFYGLPPG